MLISKSNSCSLSLGLGHQLLNLFIYLFIIKPALREDGADNGRSDIMRERKQAWKWPSQRGNWAITKVITGDTWRGLIYQRYRWRNDNGSCVSYVSEGRSQFMLVRLTFYRFKEFLCKNVFPHLNENFALGWILVSRCCCSIILKTTFQIWVL